MISWYWYNSTGPWICNSLKSQINHELSDKTVTLGEERLIRFECVSISHLVYGLLGVDRASRVWAGPTSSAPPGTPCAGSAPPKMSSCPGPEGRVAAASDFQTAAPQHGSSWGQNNGGIMDHENVQKQRSRKLTKHRSRTILHRNYIHLCVILK